MLPSTQANTGLDRHAHSDDRIRRNWQKLAGALASTQTFQPGSTFYTIASTGLTSSTNGVSTWVANTEPAGSTFYNIASTGIQVSTGGTSTVFINTAPGSTFYIIASTGIVISTNGNSTIIAAGV